MPNPTEWRASVDYADRAAGAGDSEKGAVPTMSATSAAWLPGADADRVVVSSTARARRRGVVRLPDRRDAHGVLAAVLVETGAQARTVLTALDRPGRVLAIDVERKQAVDLMAIAREVVREARIVPTKPNDATIRSLDVLLTHVVGPDLTGVRACVLGTGNLGLKASLLLAERGARLHVAGRDRAAVARTVGAVGAVLPRHSPFTPVALSDGDPVALLVTAVSASGVVGPEWLGRLTADAVVVDVGVDNVSASFCEAALAAGVRVLRLDTRAAEAQVLWPAPGFFEGTFGDGEVDGIPVVAGGIVGRRGAVVVDDTARPTTVVGVASGSGGLVPEDELTDEQREGVLRVRSVLLGG